MVATALDIVVLGIGNIVHSDDGAGVHAAKMLQDGVTLPKFASIVEGGTLGLELLPYLQHASHILLLDAVDIGAAPGTIGCLRGSEIFGLNGSWSVHQLGVADLLAALRLIRDDQPEVVILGVQPASTDWGTDLSPEVKAALPDLVKAARAELHAWSSAVDVR